MKEPLYSRKDYPVFTGVLRYFPDAILAVARVSLVGGLQHGQTARTLEWNRDLSGDDADALSRHLIEAGRLDNDEIRHSAKVAWRALAVLQKEIENDCDRP